MTCAEYWNRVFEDGLETSADTSHLAECAACAARWNRERMLAAGLRSMAAAIRGEEAPGRVEAGLVAAFRAQAGLRRRPAWSLSGWMPAVTWAAAAAASIALAVVLLHGSRPAPASVAPVAPPHRIVAPAMESADMPAEAVDETSDEADSDFIPVPNEPRIGPNEEVNVVQVETSRSALMALGIVISEDNASDTVVADLVLGSDGMPRAVRLVPKGGGSVLEEE